MSNHRGIDIRAITNERVNAIAPGLVTFSGWDSSGGGESIYIRHSNNYSSWHKHLNRRDVFTNGRITFGGQQIGGAGTTGLSSGVHLHFEIRTPGNVPINPLEFWHWDDSRFPGRNPNPAYIQVNNRFTANPNFRWSSGHPFSYPIIVNDCDRYASQRRTAFYKIDGYIIDLVKYEEWVYFRDYILTYIDNTYIMPLVKFIQHFGLSRYEVENAFDRLNSSRQVAINALTQGHNAAYFINDFMELPNLDIIFTFDNEIISAYYGR